MKQSFDVSLGYVLGHEGGYVNDSLDSGGPTNYGITQRVFSASLRKKGKPIRSVRTISPEEVAEIYREQYWDAIRGDELPVGIDYAVFDYAVNSGVRRAVEHLQEVLGVKRDGILGNVTLAAVQKRDPIELLEAYIDRRMRFLKGIKAKKGQGGWPRFGKGWTRRVLGEIVSPTGSAGDTGVIDRAVSMMLERPLPPPTVPAPGKAVVDEHDRESPAESATLQSVVVDVAAKVGAGASALAMIDDRVVQLAIVGFLGLGVIMSVIIFRERIKAWAEGWR